MAKCKNLTCGQCQSTMKKKRVSSIGTSLCISFLGICLIPALIGIPILIYGLCYHGGKFWICQSCGSKLPAV